MNGLNFTLYGWNDTENFQREFIVREVAKKLNKFYKNDYINNYHLQICFRNAILCDMDLEYPCTHPDRSKICISVQGSYWCQFIFQFSHELCHCTTSRKGLPQSIKWFDEFICCFTSYFVLKQFEHDYEVISQLYSNNTRVFSDYLQQRSAGHIYSTQNTRSMFSEFYAAYLEDENLIKNHDVYYINFFNALNGNYNGLSFIGKIHEVDTNNTNTIEEFLIKLKQICNNVEIETINLICDIFGIQTNNFDKVA